MAARLDRLLHLIDGYIRALGQMRMMNRAFLLLWAEASAAQELSSISRERDEAFRAGLSEDAKTAVAGGTVRPDVVADDVAVTVLGHLRGIALQRLVDSPAIDTQQLRQSVSDYWRRALAAQRSC